MYIGQYYHIKNKELPLDYKFGVTDSLDKREQSLGRTKSPIKYMILDAWELPSNVSREKVEYLIATIFDNEKYDGCEWYDIEETVFRGKIKIIFDILTNMFSDEKINFKKVELNKIESNKKDSIIEKEIRDGKRGAWTNLVINIDGQDFTGSNAKDGFINSIKYIINNIGIITFNNDFGYLLKENIEDFPIYKQNQLTKINDFYLSSHSSTTQKKEILENMIEKYKLNGIISIK
jgi:hypothetical protein